MPTIALLALALAQDPTDNAAVATPPETAACPAGDGLYCGGPVGLDAGHLYRCAAGRFTLERSCTAGCRSMPAGQADTCAPEAPAACPSGDGLYCGATLGRDPTSLFECRSGRVSLWATCANGCFVAPPGVPDTCKDAPTCPAGDGLYCGATVGLDPSTLYRCAAGAYTVERACGAGCMVSPPGVADRCVDAAPPTSPMEPTPFSACPTGDGLYCGATLGRDAGLLYHCAGGTITQVATCTQGCEVAPPGSPDRCRP